MSYMKSFYLLFMLLSLIACSNGGDGDNGGTNNGPAEPVKLAISGTTAGTLGIFDPSAAEDPATHRLWMSYSSIDPSSYATYNDPTITYWQVSIRLAYSDDNGANWQDSGTVVSPSVETLVGPMTAAHPGGDIPVNSEAIWQSETSSLIYDPNANAGEQWKLIWYQYLHADGRSFFADYQWIALKMAATPEELAAATPIKLFGGAGLQPENTNDASPVFAPIGGAPAIQLNSDLTNTLGAADLNDLSACIFAEPGLYANTSAVYLIVFCADASTIPTLGGITQYIVHFRCNSPCDMTSASSWEYLGRLLSPTDTQAVTTDNHFQAPSIVEKNGSAYLIVTPVDKSNPLVDRYDGCKVYKFSDLNSNQLVRHSGDLVEFANVSAVNRDSDSHHGACDAISDMQGGILLSQTGTVGTANTFQIFKSQVLLP